MSIIPKPSAEVPQELVWLADAPLFIDRSQVERFYDAVVRPDGNVGSTTLTVNEGAANTMSGKAGVEASVSPSDLLDKILTVFPFIKVGLKGNLEGSIEQTNSQENERTVELFPITNPERQLVQLTLHYLVNHTDRLFLVDNPTDERWRDPRTITEIPREIVFLNLPGQAEAAASNLPETKLIPLAAEFENGKIELLYNQLKYSDGRAITTPPRYPESASSFEELRAHRREYWRWFDEHFSATQAMLVVEEAAKEHGRIRWIDYRVPLTKEGDTLHLHIVPAGTYDTGVFAYNFIKRGYKHGLRLVGTLKSEPDMNVLAIYDK
jgi:hypothetical protein